MAVLSPAGSPTTSPRMYWTSSAERLREEKAIEARGSGSDEPVQAVFDLESGSYRKQASADGGAAETESGGDTASEEPQLDPETEAVLDALSELDVNETPPVELMAKVQEWQERLDDDA